MILCLYCEKPINKNKKYCNNLCQNRFQSGILVKRWLNKETEGWTGKTRQLRKYIRAYLYSLYGESCQQCGWNKKHPIDGAILTEIDHIDGDAENCNLDNLRILCPNCHSMTATHRARNKNSKRIRK